MHLQSWSWYFEGFWDLTKFSSHYKGKEAWLLVNMVFKSAQSNVGGILLYACEDIPQN